MSERPINPILKQVLELGPTIAFFLIYLRIKDDAFEIGGTEYSGFIVATLIFVPILLVAMGVLWALTKKLSRMQIFTAFMVIFFGGLTAWFNDERFFKMKPTMIYLLFGGVLGFGLLRGTSYLRFAMEELMPLQDEGWMKLTRRITLFFFALAAANKFIWHTINTNTWVNFKTFGLPVAIFTFFMTQERLFSNYAINDETQN